MADTRRSTLMGGNPVHLAGKALKVGDVAPYFLLTDKGMSKKSLHDYDGKIRLVSVVPSLDTGVCDLQTKRFNKEAAGFDDDVVILTVSMDLPFAQARWCGAAGIDSVVTLSDYYDANFGIAYGVLIEELRLLNRSIFIIDGAGIVRYIEIVGENHDHPDYDAAIAALHSVRG